MTIKDFDKVAWCPGLVAIHKEANTKHAIASVDFYEKTVGLKNFGGNEEGEIHWARCENIEIED